MTAGDPKSGYHACPRGYYCPARTGLDWKPCPRGTFSNASHLSAVTQCKDCPGGQYCGELHALEPTGDCFGGFYCESGVDKPDPINSENGTSLLGNCFILGLHTGEYFTFFVKRMDIWQGVELHFLFLQKLNDFIAIFPSQDLGANVP